jgi:hypothetical protein
MPCCVGWVQASTTNIADKSTQDTAACTMTLLAYNLQSVKAEYDDAIDPAVVG